MASMDEDHGSSLANPKHGSVVNNHGKVANLAAQNGQVNIANQNIHLIPQLSEEEKLKCGIDECIKTLSFPGMSNREHAIDEAIEGTCEWILEKSEFKTWKYGVDVEKNNGIFWIKGHPGVGKSTLMKHILSHCKTKHGGTNDVKIIFYFFNARGSTLEKSPLGLMRSLAVQFLEQRILLEPILDSFQTKKRRYHDLTSEWTYEELKNIFKLGFRKCQANRMILLVDALDECDQSEVQEVLYFFEEISCIARKSGSELKICLSSRHYPTVDITKKIELVVEHEIEHGRDIAIYVESKLRSPDSEIRSMVVHKSKHIFIWVVLVVQLLNNEYKRGRGYSMRKKLDAIPSNLDLLFSQLLERKDTDDEDEFLNDRRATVLLFQWVLYSKRELFAAELYFAVIAGTDPDSLDQCHKNKPSTDDIKSFVTATSLGLVEAIPRDRSYKRPRGTSYKPDILVQFIHQSVIDFLISKQTLGKLDSTLAQNVVGVSHAVLASISMEYVRYCALAWKKETGNFELALLSKVTKTRNFPLLEYAGNFTYRHAEVAATEGVDQNAFLSKLLKDHDLAFLNWAHDHDEMVTEDIHSGADLTYVLPMEDYPKLLHTFLLENQNIDINALTGQLGTALQAAAYNSNIDVVELLLERGADPNIQGGRFGNALQAAAWGSNIDVVGLLLERGADPNIQGGRFGNALHAATYRGSIDIVKLLLERGVDPNIQGGKYGNALHAAAWGRSIDVVELLLKRGADPNIQGGHFGNALQAAAFSGNIDIVKLLLKRGADPNTQGGHFGNALQAAAFSGNIDIVKLLLERGVDPNIQGGHLGNALQAAAFTGSINVINLLLECGVDPNIQGGCYGTALQAAVELGNPHQRGQVLSVVELLLKYGANMHARCGKDESAWEIAETSKLEEVLELFREHAKSTIGRPAVENEKRVLDDAMEKSAKRLRIGESVSESATPTREAEEESDNEQ